MKVTVDVNFSMTIQIEFNTTPETTIVAVQEKAADFARQLVADGIHVARNQTFEYKAVRELSMLKPTSISRTLIE